MERFRLSFTSPFHVSSGGYGLESANVAVDSDTLFSAVCHTARMLYGDAGVEQLLRPGAVRLSSTFPYMRRRVKSPDGTPTVTYFLPRPLAYQPPLPDADSSLRKSIKKVQFIDEKLFGRLDTLDPLDDADQQKSNGHKKRVGGLWASHGLPDGGLLNERELPRVTLDRVTHASTLFYFSEVEFRKGCGLYVLAEFSDQDVRRMFVAALRLLGDEGLGADGTVGKGQFQVYQDAADQDVQFPDANNPNARLLLSLYNPTRAEQATLKLDESAYGLTTRRGWTSFPGAASMRRLSVRAFTAGSVLRTDADLQGRLVDVLDLEETHGVRIRRNLQALSLPYRL
ncbi:MAG: type III-A CRISPR-associated RAMP protein Csm4 [Bacteroidota bacterium]